MENTALQLNEDVKGYLRVPYSHYRTIGSRSRILILSAIHTFSDAERRCNKTYHTFERELQLSHGTVARGIKALKAENRIDQDKSRRTGASYTCTQRTTERGFVKIELYLYATKFQIRGKAEPRYLTHAEIDVLALIKTHCANERGKGHFDGSMRGMAHTLNLSKTTVQNAIDTLLKAELIYRPSHSCGINGHKRSEYTVNKKLLRRSEKNYNKKSAPKGDGAQAKSKTMSSREEQRVQAANERSEREQYYAAFRHTAIDRAEHFNTRLERDDTYKRVNAALRAMQPKIARAEIFDTAELAQLIMDERRLKAERAKRMAELNISEADLIPKWHCPKCEDTGFMKDGRICDCYPIGRRKQ